jgi:hypothetical protein
MLALAACAVALLVVGAEAQQGSQAEGGRFVKVGGHHINVDRILYTRAVGDSLEVVFGGDGGRERLRLAGDEAKAMRRWLDERSVDLMASRPGKVIMEGVDINVTDPLRKPQVPPGDPRR